VTIFVRSSPSAPWFADSRLAIETVQDGRLTALQAAIAEGRYRIDAKAIAAQLIAALGSRAGYGSRRH
jgi:Anti-sigma-28 factor, FlgM